MERLARRITKRLLGAIALAAAGAVAAVPAHAESNRDLERSFDRAFGTELRGPPSYDTPFEQRIATLANAAQGRIGVAAIDLETGHTLQVLGDQPFPMASTSKIAVAATFLEGVERGRWSLSSEFPLLIPVKSAPFSSSRAPVRRGAYLPAIELIELMITRSSNPATDALLAAVGGPKAVNDWARRAGITDFSIDRDIATLVRDDGAVDPATTIERRDSATPLAMAQLLAGLHRGDWLSASSRAVILGAMSRCVTGKRRIPALMPAEARVAHKTGSLNNTSSDVGIITGPDGRSVAVAIYVTGQGGRPNREARIASIARALYDGYFTPPQQYRTTASR
jgi:beta-lactamase class A